MRMAAGPVRTWPDPWIVGSCQKDRPKFSVAVSFLGPARAFHLGVTTIPVTTLFRFRDANIVLELFSVSWGELRTSRSFLSSDRSFKRTPERLVEK